MKRKDFIKVSGIVALSPMLCPKILSAKTMDGAYEMTIRIHHFFDIVRTLGTKKDEDLIQAKTKHSYHIITHKIRDNANIKIKIVLGVDSVCEGCVNNINNHCISGVGFENFTDLNDYNNYLDKRILEKCNIKTGQVITPKEACLISDKYINNFEYIYELNDKEKTKIWKHKFIEGLQFYSQKHSLSLGFLIG